MTVANVTGQLRRHERENDRLRDRVRAVERAEEAAWSLIDRIVAADLAVSAAVAMDRCDEDVNSAENALWSVLDEARLAIGERMRERVA